MKDDILLFSYFKGHGDGLHLAVSMDGYQWKALAGDQVMVAPRVGVERIFRDPCLYFGHDEKFHLVWTVGWREKSIGYCSSEDLITWSDQVCLPVMEHEEKAWNCWAPEIFYDEYRRHYMVYWSTTIEGKFPETQPFGDDGFNHRIYYVTTRDFITFSETKLLYDGGFNVIDANIVSDGEGYLIFMKDETLVPPRKHLRLARGIDPYHFSEAGSPITSPHYWAEGPTGIRIDGRWIVYFDKYKINRIGAVQSSDLIHWEDISDQLHFPAGAQHGYVCRVPRKFIERLL